MVKVASEDNNDRTKDLLQKTKDGFIQKKKNQKHKQMPPEKIALINGWKPSNGNNEAKQQLLNKQKNSGSKKSAEQNTKDSLKGDKKLQETSKNRKAESEEDDSDSDEDINEGIVLEEHSILQESSEAASEDEEESEDGSENEQSLPSILGTSLADDTDEDDDDYEDDEEAEEVEEVKKGVKMFKGLKSKEKTTDSLEKKFMDGSQFSSDNDDEEDDDEEDDEGAFKGDGSDDEEGSEEDDEDDEEDEDDEDDDDDDDDEGESEDEGDESMLNWEAILGSSIVEDDEDDEDFNEPENMDEDDDDDISDEDEDEEEEEEKSNSGSSKKEKTKKTIESLDVSLEEMKEDKRTIFVGNLPKEVTRKQLKKYFKKFGSIDTVRVRGVIGKSMKMSKKVAAIKNDLHPKLKSVYAYIKYKSEESTKAALSMNGKLFDGNHLRVDLASKSDENHDVKKAIFIGNMPFNIDENTVRKHFKGCGEIESIRIVRDNNTGVGRGFGYINFKTEDAVALALELNGTSLLNRELRVKPCSDHPKKEKKDKQKRRPSLAEEEKKSNKKFKKDDEVAVPVHNKKNATKRLNEKGQKFDAKQTSPQQSKAFQGQTSEGKKKKKSNKLEKKKKVMAEKLAAKSKKPSN